MKSHFFKIQNLRKIFQKQWHWAACALLVVVAAVKKSWNEPRSARPATESPNELPAKKPSAETDDAPVIKFTENAPTAAAAEQEAKVTVPKFFEKKPSQPAVPALSEAEKEAFLQRFGKTAVEEKRKFGIPASLILASGLVQSFAGKRDAARAANNFFGLAADSQTAVRFESEGRSFQKFSTAWDSFRAHSQFVSSLLKNENRPAATDWRAWARLLAQKNGYSSVENWEREVAEVIEKHDLAALDR